MNKFVIKYRSSYLTARGEWVETQREAGRWQTRSHAEAVARQVPGSPSFSESWVLELVDKQELERRRCDRAKRAKARARARSAKRRKVVDCLPNTLRALASRAAKLERFSVAACRSLLGDVENLAYRLSADLDLPVQ